MSSEILNFISRVVPWGHDLVNLHWKIRDRPGMPGLPFKTSEDLLGYAAYAAGRPKRHGDIYICMSSQLKAGKTVQDKTWALRNGDNVAAFKAIWLDVDGYKDYTSLTEALAAIHKFIVDAGLPAPTALVCSGGGWHVYFISDKDLTETEWRPYAEGLWALAVKHGLRADAGVTTDSVRVLRVPGTFNHKSDPPKSVKLVALAATDYAFESTLGHIRVAQGIISRSVARVKHTDVCDLTKFTGQPLVPADDRGIGLEFNGAPLALEPLLGEGGCPHLVDACRTHGAHYAQPLWHMDALLATFLENGRKVFHYMSNGHPAYSSVDTDAMFDRKVNEREERSLGRPSCVALEGAGCTSCKICPHKGQIRSPLNLTRPAATPFLSQHDTDINVGISAQAPTSATPFNPNSMLLPRGYRLDAKGRLCERIPKIVAGLQPHDEWDMLISNKIWGPPYMTSDPTSINFSAITNKNEERAISVPFEATADAKALRTVLAAQDINIKYGKEEAVLKYFKAWTEVLQDALDAQKNAPYGWVTAEGGTPTGFNYGGRMYNRDGTDQPFGKTDVFSDIYRSYGEEDIWFQVLDLVTKQGRPALEAIVAASFASPLLYITGQHGGTVVAVGRGGANKSTAVDIGNAVWGMPLKAKAVLGATTKGVMKKLTDLHNLPMYWDDVKGKKLSEAASIVGQATEGQDPLKLTSSRHYAPTGTWQCMLIMAANASIIDELLKSSKTDAAQLYRVFQFDVPKVPDIWPGQVKRSIAAPLQQQLEYNYGRVGARYAKRLGSAVDEITTAVLQIQDKFSAEVKEKQEERFWVAVCATIWAGAHLANKDLGTNFHLTELWTFLKQAYFELREKVVGENLEGGSEINTERYLTGFFKEEGNHTLTTWDMVKEQGKPQEFLRVVDQPDFVRFPSTHINVHWVIDDKLVRLSKLAFRTYIESQDTQPSFVLKGLKEHFGMYEQAKVRLHAGLRVGGGGGREPVLVIPIKPGTWLHDELMSRAPKPLKGEDHQVSLAVGPVENPK